MKTFTQLIKETKYDQKGNLITTPEKAIKVLERTRKSIQSHSLRGGSNNSQRGQELIDRYEEHKEYLIQHAPSKWKEYSKKIGSHEEHDGSDFYV